MKKYVLKIAEADKDTFEFIKSGKKKVETRAGSVKYQNIKDEDVLILFCTGKKFEKRVKKVFHSNSIKELLKKYSPRTINPSTNTEKELTEVYYGYPNYKEKIKKFGLLAFELE